MQLERGLWGVWGGRGREVCGAEMVSEGRGAGWGPGSPVCSTAPCGLTPSSQPFGSSVSPHRGRRRVGRWLPMHSHFQMWRPRHRTRGFKMTQLVKGSNPGLWNPLPHDTPEEQGGSWWRLLGRPEAPTWRGDG